MMVGSHVPASDPLGAAAARAADCVQLFLSNPQGWRAPEPRDDTAVLRDAALSIYVHAPYLVNVASPNNKVRVPSRRILADTCEAAASIGAAGVIVHGGHVGAESDLAVGFDNWRKALERIETDVPILIENTAGGQHAMTRYVEVIDRLWQALDGLPVGFCLDTCHAHAAGEDLTDIVSRIRSVIGRIDLVHVNDSKDDAGSGRDRHENLGEGTIPPEMLEAMVIEAQAPALVETPGDAAAQAADIAWLRERIATDPQR